MDDVNSFVQTTDHIFIPSEQIEAKMSWLQVLPTCAGDIIWSQKLHGSDREVETWYQGPDCPIQLREHQ